MNKLPFMLTLILTLAALPVWFGASAAAQPLADYNGDGYADLAIGVPGELVNDQLGAGMVNVIYGSASGLSATAVVPDQRFFQDFSIPGNPASNISDVSEAGDSFGDTLASGDFNNDGHTDLAIGVPDEDVGPDVDAGAVNVIYGSPSGLSSAVLDDQFWHQDSANIEDFTDTSEHFGSALAAGDFNGDGYDDLAVGTPLDYVDSIGGAGSANVIYGSPSGLSAAADQLWHQNIPGIEDSVDFGDHFASSLAAGDFNNDGIDDLAAGVPDEDVNSQANAGLVNIIYGSVSGLTSASDQRFFQDYSVPGDPASNMADSSEPNDRFGAALAVGDFDNDGSDDLLIGIPLEDISAGDQGAVAAVYGSPSGLAAAGNQLWSQDSPGLGDGGGGDGANAGEEFGTALASGDFNNDGHGDFAASAPQDNAGAASATPGVVNFVFGSPSGLSATAVPDQVWVGNNRLGGVRSMASGDFDGDGFGDLAMGQPSFDFSQVFFELHPRGAATVLYGSSGELGSDEVWTQDAPNVDDSAEDGEAFGSSVSAG